MKVKKYLLLFSVIFCISQWQSIAQNIQTDTKLLGEWVSVIRLMNNDSQEYTTESFTFLNDGKLKAQDTNAPVKSLQSVEGTWNYNPKQNILEVVFISGQMRDSEKMEVKIIYNVILKLTIKRNNRSLTRIMVRKNSGLDAKAVKEILKCAGE